MTNDPTDWLARYQAEQQRRQAQLTILKDALLDELRLAGITTVTVSYDGEGDNGQIQGIVVEDASQNAVEIEDKDIWGELDNQITEFTWHVLQVHHDGYENNDGGFGKLTIDVAARSVDLDHNDRVMESVNTMTEV